MAWAFPGSVAGRSDQGLPAIGQQFPQSVVRMGGDAGQDVAAIFVVKDVDGVVDDLPDQPVGSPGDVDAADHLQECPGDVAPTCIAVVVPGAFAIVDGSKRRPGVTRLRVGL